MHLYTVDSNFYIERRGNWIFFNKKGRGEGIHTSHSADILQIRRWTCQEHDIYGGAIARPADGEGFGGGDAGVVGVCELHCLGEG